MNDWSETRSTSSALLMSNVAISHGMSKQACLKNTGISEVMLNDSNAEIKASQELKLIENIVDELGDTSIALEIGGHVITSLPMAFGVLPLPAVQLCAQPPKWVYAFYR